MALAGGDVSWADNLRRRGTGIVIQRVGSQVHILGTHLDVEVEDGHLRLRVILAPVGDERRLAVNHLSAFKEVGVVVDAVEVQTVGIEGRSTVLQLDVIARDGHLVVAVVEGIVAEQREGVALVHLHVAEGLERVAGLIEIGAVAMQRRPLVTELHLTVQYLRLPVLELVVVQNVGVNQIDVLVLGLSGTARLLLGGRSGGGGEEHQHEGCGNAAAQPTKPGRPTGEAAGTGGVFPGYHLIQPWYSNSQSR